MPPHLGHGISFTGVLSSISAILQPAYEKPSGAGQAPRLNHSPADVDDAFCQSPGPLAGTAPAGRLGLAFSHALCKKHRKVMINREVGSVVSYVLDSRNKQFTAGIRCSRNNGF
jgi:hypothetical protein